MFEIIFDIITGAIRLAIVLALSFASIMCFIGGIKVLLADKAIYNRNHRTTGNILNTIKGTVPGRRGRLRNDDVTLGLAYDLKNKKVIAQGALSDEAVNKILR